MCPEIEASNYTACSLTTLLYISLYGIKAEGISDVQAMRFA